MRELICFNISSNGSNFWNLGGRGLVMNAVQGSTHAKVRKTTSVILPAKDGPKLDPKLDFKLPNMGPSDTESCLTSPQVRPRVAQHWTHIATKQA